jgi:group I intron endonuclease
MAYGYIYAITQLTTGRYYIGQTRTSVLQRWFSHVYCAKKTAQCIIDRVMAKRGISEFTCETIAIAESQEQLDQLEKLWIIATNSRNCKYGFNARHGGNGGGEISAESRLRMSESAKRRVANDPNWADRNRRIVEKIRGKKRRPYSDKARANFSAGQMRRHLANPEYVKTIRNSENAKTAHVKRWAARDGN